MWAAWTTDARGRVQHDPIYRLSLGEEITDCVCKPSGAEETDLDTRYVFQFQMKLRFQPRFLNPKPRL